MPSLRTIASTIAVAAAATAGFVVVWSRRRSERARAGALLFFMLASSHLVERGRGMWGGCGREGGVACCTTVLDLDAVLLHFSFLVTLRIITLSHSSVDMLSRTSITSRRYGLR